MLPEKSFDTGELKLNYGEGVSSGSPMVLLHGLTSWWPNWAYILPHLTSWHVYAPDLRGHGKSGRVAHHYCLTDYAQDIVTFLRQQVKEPTILVGHSLGALTALAAAAQTPESLKALILLDPPLYLRNSPTGTSAGAQQWFSWVQQTLQSASSYQDVVARLQKDTPQSDEAMTKRVADQIYSLDVGTVDNVLQNRLLEGWDLKHALHSITCPTLLMRGDWDHGAAVRDEDAAFVRESLPSVLDVKIPNGTHQFPSEQLDLTLSHINKFLQSV